ncbi:MAG: hypothetical protein AAF518_07180 [Spirochaetota bacterium]
MAFFDKVIGLFFEEVPEKTPPVKSSNNKAVGVGSSNDEAVYEKFCASLQGAIEAANLPGFDFFEFYQLYKKFLQEGRSERQAVKEALHSSQTMRIDKQTLLTNYKHYEKTLQAEKKIFDNDLDNFYQENIKDPKGVSQQIDRDIQEKLLLIQQCQNDIQKLEQKKQNLGIDVNSAESQLRNVRIAFAKAYGTISNELYDLYEKLKKI